MTDDQRDDEELDAGAFTPWLAGVQRALRGEASSDVPCGDCTACCTASQFIHIGPDETDTLAHVPSALRFPAPGLPEGHVVLGYDEHGRCPMLVDNACSIYAHRPRTCRTYDCRIFPATGVDLTHDGKPLIAARARRWRFDLATDDDRARQAALRAAAGAVHEREGGSNPTRQAVLAVEIHDLFLATDERGGLVVVTPPPEVVAAAIGGRTRQS